MPYGPDLRDVSFGEFCTQPCYLERQQGVKYLSRAASPVDHWNNMNFHWSSRMAGGEVIHLRHDDLIRDPEGAIEYTAERAGVVMNDKFVNTEFRIPPQVEHPIPGNTIFDETHYVDRAYMKEFDQDLLHEVNRRLDPSVMSLLGYEATKCDKCLAMGSQLIASA